MSPKQKHRLIGTFLLIGGSVVAFFLVVMALRQNIDLFFSPKQLAHAKEQVGQRIRVGGIVKEGSVIQQEGLKVAFVIRDTKDEGNAKHCMQVEYQGILPDLFKEGKGIVVGGILESPSFLRAEEVLAKHDENYKPKE